MASSLLHLYRDAFSGLPRDIWVLGTAAFVNRVGTMVLPFLSLYLTRERGLSLDHTGMFVGIYGLGSVAGSLLGGWLSDRIGAVRTQRASLVAGGMSLLVLARLTALWHIGIGLFVVATINDAFRPAVMASFAERSPSPVRLKAFAFLRLAANLGIGIGPALGGWLALYGYRWLFVVDALTCWAGALVLLAVVPLSERHRDGRAPDETARSPWSDGPFLLLLLLSMVLISTLFQIFSTFPLYLREEAGVREDGIGMLLSFSGLIIVAFEMVLIHLVRDRDRVQVAGLGAFCMCLGFGMTGFGGGLWFFAFTVAVWTFGEMLALPVLNLIAAERSQAGSQGQYMGLYMMAYSVAFILAPVAGTYVYDEFGPAMLWSGIGALGPLLWLALNGLGRSLRA